MTPDSREDVACTLCGGTGSYPPPTRQVCRHCGGSGVEPDSREAKSREADTPRTPEGDEAEIEGWAFEGWEDMSTVEITVGHAYTGMVPVSVRIRRREGEPIGEPIPARPSQEEALREALETIASRHPAVIPSVFSRDEVCGECSDMIDAARRALQGDSES